MRVIANIAVNGPVYGYRNDACCICNTPHTGEVLIDLDVMIDQEGRLCIGESCVDEMNALLGKMTAGAVARVEERIRIVSGERDALQRRLDEGRRVLR